MMRKLVILMLFIPFLVKVQTEIKQDSIFNELKMEWFKDAKPSNLNAVKSPDTHKKPCICGNLMAIRNILQKNGK